MVIVSSHFIVSLSNVCFEQVHKLKPCQNNKSFVINKLRIFHFYIYGMQWIVLRRDVNCSVFILRAVNAVLSDFSLGARKI